eukprot:CAMPEP_0198599526 /NCGR_PEP_ID=MMETSP1462-20131121/147038_1 /TAXON_ID=1333877 /ORGANISM="Brandtodinium nutriculum, Strain RCC3387" /LENGTH=82 /DNA_ID=CAMNT_0044331215 /DNA_START=22 /DNA_END=267 /DNA_ORIENTATION=+
MFREELNLSASERSMRAVAREHEIPLTQAEQIYSEFSRYAEAGTLQFDEFSRLLNSKACQRAPSCTTDREQVPESRIRVLWQ